MPKDGVSISHMEFIRLNDDMFEVILDPTVTAYLATMEQQDLVAWYDEQAPLLGERFAMYCKGHAPEVQVTTPQPPPRQVKLVLRYALPRKHQEHIIGDLEEAYYTEWLPEHGPREAGRLYWWHAIWSIAPMVWIGVKRSGIITAIVGAAQLLFGTRGG